MSNIWKRSLSMFLAIVMVFGMLPMPAFADETAEPGETPVVDQPVVDEPVVDEPVVDEPVVDEPVVDEPVVDEPVVDKPVVDEPVVDEPVVDEPVVDEPVVDEPVVDEPVVDEPVVDEPVVEDEVLTLSGETRKVYFLNTESWTGVYAAWSFEEEDFADAVFPGVAMEADEELENVFVIELPVEADDVVFNDGVEVTEDLLAWEAENGGLKVHAFDAELDETLDYFSADEQVEDAYDATEWLSYEDVLEAQEAAEVAAVQAMIDALPTEFASQDEVDFFWDVTAAELDAAIAELNDEQYGKLNTAKYDAAIDAAAAFAYPELEGGSYATVTWSPDGGTGTADSPIVIGVKDAATVSHADVYEILKSSSVYNGEPAFAQHTYAYGGDFRINTQDRSDTSNSGWGKNDKATSITQNGTGTVATGDTVYYVWTCTDIQTNSGWITTYTANYGNMKRIQFKTYFNPTVDVIGKDGVEASAVTEKIYSGGSVSFTLPAMGETGWTATVKGLNDAVSLNADTATTITVSNITSADAAAITVMLQKAEIYDVTLNKATPDYGTASIDKTSGINGTVVTVTATPNANTASENYALASIIVNDTPINGNTFTINGADAEVVVTFTKTTIKKNTTIGTVGFNPKETVADQLDTLKNNIFTAVVNSGESLPEGIKYTDLDYKYYPWSNITVWNLFGDNLEYTSNEGEYVNLAELDAQATEWNLTVAWGATYAFGGYWINGGSATERVLLTGKDGTSWAGLSVEANITLIDSRDPMPVVSATTAQSKDGAAGILNAAKAAATAAYAGYANLEFAIITEDWEETVEGLEAGATTNVTTQATFAGDIEKVGGTVTVTVVVTKSADLPATVTYTENVDGGDVTLTKGVNNSELGTGVMAADNPVRVTVSNFKYGDNNAEAYYLEGISVNGTPLTVTNNAASFEVENSMDEVKTYAVAVNYKKEALELQDGEYEILVNGFSNDTKADSDLKKQVLDDVLGEGTYNIDEYKVELETAIVLDLNEWIGFGGSHELSRGYYDVSGYSFEVFGRQISLPPSWFVTQLKVDGETQNNFKITKLAASNTSGKDLYIEDVMFTAKESREEAEVTLGDEYKDYTENDLSALANAIKGNLDVHGAEGAVTVTLQENAPALTTEKQNYTATVKVENSRNNLETTKEFAITANISTYTVTWYDEDGTTVLYTQENVPYGTAPGYAGEQSTDELAAAKYTAQYTYTFDKWETTGVAANGTITGNATYTASYTATTNTYDVIWKDAGGTVLYTQEDVPYGTTPVYAGEKTTEELAAAKNSVQYTYTFAGWTPEVTAVTGEAIYTATYTSTVNKYIVTFVDGNGANISAVEYDYGTLATAITVPTTAAKADLEDVAGNVMATYTFTGWDKEIAEVTGAATYTATFTEVPKEYTITWKMDDGSTLGTTTVKYGAIPVYDADPEKEGVQPPAKASDSEDIVYNFKGWDTDNNGEIAVGEAPKAVTGEATYTAVFTTTKLYEVKVVYGNGDKDATDNVEENSEYEIPADPSWEGYRFDGWFIGETKYEAGTVYTVTGDTVIEAKWTNVIKVTYVDHDGSEIEKTYYEGNTAENITPTEWEDHDFLGWYNGEEAFDFTTVFGHETEDITLTAKWIADRNDNDIEDGSAEDPFHYYIWTDGTNELKKLDWLTGEDEITVDSYKYQEAANDGKVFSAWSESTVGDTTTYTVVLAEDANNNEVADEKEMITVSKTDADVTGTITVSAEGLVPMEDGVTYVYDSVNGNTITIKASPEVSGNALTGYVSSTYVSGIKVDGAEQELDYDNDYSVTYTLNAKAAETETAALAENAVNHEVEITFAKAEFTYDEDGEMAFYVGMELPDKETLYNAVISGPAYGEPEVQSITYRAREAGKQDINLTRLGTYIGSIPVIGTMLQNAFNSITNNGVISVDLDERWLPIDTDPDLFKVEYDEVTDQLIDEIIAEVGKIDITKPLEALGQAGVVVQKIYNLGTTLATQLEYLGCHAFGATASPDESATEILKVVYENDAMHIEDDEIVVTLIDDRDTAYIQGGNVTFKYNLYTDDDIMDAIYLTDVDGNVISGEIYKYATLAGNNVGEYTYNVYFDGNDDYKPAQTKFTLTVEKAPVSIDFDSQTVIYGTEYDFTLVKNPADVDTIDFMIGLDLADGVAPYIQLNIPPIDLFGIKIEIPAGEYNLSSFIEMISGLLGGIDGIGEIIDILTEVQNTIGLSDIMVKVNGDMHPKDIGLYLAGAVTVDQNYETAYTVDYLMVVPDAQKADLEWVYKDSNGIFTPELLQHSVMGAYAKVNGEESADATADIQYLFVSLTTDAQGEMVFDLIQEDAETVNGVSANGAYTQMAYILDWGNSFYYAVPIVRAFAIMPNTVKVEIVDEEGTNFVRTFNNKEQKVKVDLTYTGGTAIDTTMGELTVNYAGIQSNTQPWNSDTAPTHAGVYVVTATYVQTDEETGNIIAIGVDVQTLTILPAKTETTVNDKIVTVGSGDEVEDLFVVDTNNSGVTMPDMTIITAQIASDGTFSENGWSAIKGNVNVDFPDWVDGVLEQYAPSLLDGMTVAEFSAKVDGKLSELAAKLNELGLNAEVTDALIKAINEVTAVLEEVPDNVTVTFNNISDHSAANVGAYLVAAIVTDSDHIPSADYGILVVTPDVTAVELKWNYEDENNIWTRELLEHYDLKAKAFDKNGDENTQATDKITYQFIGIDKNGDLIVSNTQEADQLPNGAYIQLAYINLEVDGVMTVSNLIARELLILPSSVDVTFVDVNNNNARSFTFDNTPKKMDVVVKINGTEITPAEDDLTVTYVGMQSNTIPYNSTTAPTHAGVYTVIADYREYTSEGSLSHIGGAVGIMAIEPAESTITMDDTAIVAYKGERLVIADELNIQVASAANENLTPDVTIITASIAANGDFSENGWKAVDGTINVDFPEWVDELIHQYAPSVANGITVKNFSEKLVGKLPDISAKLEEIGATNEIVNSLNNAVKNVAAVLENVPENVSLSFEDDATAKGVGAYAVVGIVTDSDHIPAMDAGILVIVPDVTAVELKWNHEDENNIWTRELLKTADLKAKAYNIKTGAYDETATAKITYQFIGMDKNGKLIVTNPQNADELPNGAYIELAYIELEVGGEMVISDLIARNIAIVPGTAQVVFVDVNGNINHDQMFTFDNTQKEMKAVVKINGTTITPAEGTLTVKYVGVQTNGKTYELSETAPTHAGIYTVVAAYKEYTSEGSTANIGGALGIMAIEPAQSEIAVTGGTVTYDGEGHTAKVEITKGYEFADYILISGGAYVSGNIDEVGVDAFHGNVNIDLPRWLNEALAEYEFSEGIDPAYLTRLIGSYRNELVAAIPTDVLAQLGLDKAEIEAKVNAFIDELLKVLEKLPEDVKLTFEDDITYTEPGAYVYYGIVTDSDHYPSTDTGLLVIEKQDALHYDLIDTTVTWDGGRHMVDIDNPSNTDALTLIIDRANNTMNIRLDNDAQYLLNTLARILNVEFDGDVNIGTIVNQYKGEEIAAALVKLINEAEALNLSEDIAKALAAIKAELVKLPDTEGTIIVNGGLPSEIGKYEVYAITYSQYYKTAASEAILEIVPVEVKVELYDNTKVYGAEDPELTYTVTYYDHEGNELADADAVAVDVERVEGENVGEYAITATVTLTDDAHYVLIAQPEAAVFEITKAPVTITIESAEITYGAKTPEVVLNYSDEAAKDEIVPNITWAAPEYADAGEYTSTISTEIYQNWDVTYVGGKLTVKKAPVVVGINNVEKFYGEEDTADQMVYTVTEGLKEGAELTVTMNREDGSENVGIYELTPVATMTGDDLNNYDITYQYADGAENATLTIKKATVTITLKDAEMTVDGPVPAMEYTVEYEGVVSDDELQLNISWKEPEKIGESYKRGEYTDYTAEYVDPVGAEATETTEATYDNWDVVVVDKVKDGEAERDVLLTVTAGDYVCWNMQTGVYYDDLSDALEINDGAEEETIQMLKNYDENYVIVAPGTTLDLADHTVTANFVIVLKEGYLAGDVEVAKLVVDPKNFGSLNTDCYVDSIGYDILPIYNPDGYFQFSRFQVSTTGNNRGLRIDENELYFQFVVNTSGFAFYDLLPDGATDNELKFVVRLEWSTATGTAYQDFVFEDQYVGATFSNAKDLYLRMEGYQALGFDENTVDVKGMVISTSQITSVGTVW